MLKKMKSWNSVWEKIFSTRKWGQYPETTVIRFIAKNFLSSPKSKQIKILDLGCGVGAHSWYLARERFSVYGIDGPPIAIKLAKIKLKKEKLKAKLVIGDIINLPYQDNFFDAVIDSATIQHNSLVNIKIILKEIYRVLKPKGKIFSTMVAQDNYLKQGFGQIHFFTKPQIKQLLVRFSQLTVDCHQYNIQKITESVCINLG